MLTDFKLPVNYSALDYNKYLCFRISSSTRSHGKRRAAGDGMATEVEDPELIFELPDHTDECQCACEHVVYGPGYTCLQVSHN